MLGTPSNRFRSPHWLGVCALAAIVGCKAGAPGGGGGDTGGRGGNGGSGTGGRGGGAGGFRVAAADRGSPPGAAADRA